MIKCICSFKKLVEVRMAKVPLWLKRVKRRFGRKIEMKPGLFLNPGKNAMRESIHIVIPRREWPYGSAALALTHTAEDQPVLFIRKTA